MDLEIREIRPDEVEAVCAFWKAVGDPQVDAMSPQKLRTLVLKYSGLSLCAWDAAGALVASVMVTPVAGGYRMRLVADKGKVNAADRQIILNKATMKLASRGVQRCQISVNHSAEADDLLPQLRWHIDEDFSPAATRFAATPGELLDDSPLATEASLPPAVEEHDAEAVHAETPELVRA